MWKQSLIAAGIGAVIGGLVVAQTMDSPKPAQTSQTEAAPVTQGAAQNESAQQELTAVKSQLAELQEKLNTQFLENSELKTQLKTYTKDHPDIEAAREQSQHFAMIREQMSNVNIQVGHMEQSKVAGLYEVNTNRGIAYINPTGRYILLGNLFEVEGQTVENLTEKSMMSLRLEKLKEVEKDMIIYPAKDEKHVVTIFTDTNCGYCRKLHNEMADYNAAGITVRYLAFPRGGQRSGTFQEMVNIWCADDRNKAMDLAKAGQKLETRTCENPVGEHYDVGNLFGVTGTPAIILENGQLQPGYMPAARMSAVLEQLLAQK